MKKKRIKYIFLSIAVISVILINLLTSYTSEIKENRTSKVSLLQLNVAHAQNNENWKGMTWQEVADYFESIDEAYGVKNAVGDGTPTDHFFDTIHAVCDATDIMGDPAFEWMQAPDGSYAWGQTDDCDGQPNWC